MNNTESNTRLHYMDAMRSTLMIFGIVLHSANVFSDKEWAIQNIETSIIFLNLVDIIHTFRMPAFFIVSGFFCHMTLKKCKSLQFSKVRIPRILIPLIVTALTLNILQNYILHSLGYKDILFNQYLYWAYGDWDSHLWFLNCLVYYFSLSALLYALIPSFLTSTSNLINNIFKVTKGTYLVLLPVATYILLKVSYLIPSVGESDYDFSVSDSIKYSGFFIFGILLGDHRNLLHKFNDPKSIKFALFLSVLIILIYLLTKDSQPNVLFKEYVEQLITWLSCIFCFYLFFRFFNKRSGLFTYLASASYSIYLFHHILVILFGIFIIKFNINIWFKFSFLVISVFIATNLIHYFIVRKSSMFSMLYNGKKPNAK